MSRSRDVIRDHGYTILANWHRLSGSHLYYIQRQCDEAKEDNAPKNVIYWRYEAELRNLTPAEERFIYRAPFSGRLWFTVDHITNEDRRQQLGLSPLPNSHPVAVGRARRDIEYLEFQAEALRKKHNITDRPGDGGERP